MNSFWDHQFKMNSLNQKFAYDRVRLERPGLLQLNKNKFRKRKYFKGFLKPLEINLMKHDEKYSIYTKKNTK